MLKYEIVPVTPYAQNCSIVWCDQTMKAAIIDPGGDVDNIQKALQKLGVQAEQIWITHAHFDHAGGAAELAENMNLPIYGPQKDDAYWIDFLANEAKNIPGFECSRPFTPTRWLNDLDELSLGEELILVRHCPGHTPGHVIFFSDSARCAFVGDVLFARSIGRTDFPGGNHEQLIASITQKLFPLGDDVVFIPGHGPDSTIGQERQNNPYLTNSAY